MSESIFIVVNSCPKKTTIERRAHDTQRVTLIRIKREVDIMAAKRFAQASSKLSEGTKVVMYQGGARTYRGKYGSGNIVAAGKVIKAPRAFNKEVDALKYDDVIALNKECFSDWSPTGIVFYEFPKCIAKQPLLREEIFYEPKAGDNFVDAQIALNDKGYSRLCTWWGENC